MLITMMKDVYQINIGNTKLFTVTLIIGNGMKVNFDINDPIYKL
jgi:hypothetical protein